MKQITLRPYQEECVDLIDNLEDGSKVIVSLATGLGKTVIFSHIKRDGHTLILSHRDELVTQPEKYYDCSYGIEKAEKHANGEEVISASVQTLSRPGRLSKYSPDYFTTIIVDEAHHAAAPTYKRILSHFTPKKLIGFTATPKRGDNVRLDDVFDRIAFNRDVFWGIENKYLCDLKNYVISAGVSLNNVRFTAGDYNLGDLIEAIDRPEMYTAIAKAYNDYCYSAGRHTIIYCLSKQGCDCAKAYIEAMIPESKGTIAIITSDTDSEERTGYEEDYKNGRIMCLINCMVLTEGVDLPMTDAIIVARPTANPTLYTQIVGRGTRLYEGKENCLILDIMPESRHAICSASTLLGEDFRSLKSSVARKLQQDGLTLTEMVDIINESAKTQARIIEIFADECELLREEIDSVRTLIEDSYQDGNIKALASAVEDRKKEELEKCSEYGISDTCGLIYKIGPSDKERFIIQGSPSDGIFVVSEPDMLGKVTVTAKIDRVIYQTSEPVSSASAFQDIQTYLSNHYSNTAFMWMQGARDSWKDDQETDSQFWKLNKSLNNAGLSSRGKIIDKYHSSMLIDFFNDLNGLENRLARRKSEANGIAALEDYDKALEYYNQSRNELVTVRTTENVTDISSIFAECHVPRSSSSITVKKDPFPIMPGSKPSQKQLSFARSLFNGLSRNNIVLGNYWEKKVISLMEESESMEEISMLITVLKDITNRIPKQAGKNTVVDVSDMFEKLSEQDKPIIIKYEYEDKE